MKIWLVNQYAVPPSQAGPTRHYALARELIRRGHEVTIVASSFDHVSRKETRIHGSDTWVAESIDGVKFIWVKTPPYRGNSIARVRNMLVFAWRVVALGRHWGERPDVILGSSPHLFAALGAKQLAVRLGVPFALEVRDLWPQSMVDLGEISPRHPLIKAMEVIERYLYRNSRCIISVLPGAVEHMVKHGATREKVIWCPNGVDRANLCDVVPPPKGHLFTVMYAGTHGLANGLDLLLDAAMILERKGWNGRFRLVGDGPHKARLMERASCEGISCVTFEPAVPKGEVFQVLEEADAFLMLLKDSPVFKWGVSPNKLFDYMACGRPIIFTVSSPYNPVAMAQAGITTSSVSPESLAEAVWQLSETDSLTRAGMGRNGRQYVEQFHTFDVIGGRLENALRDIV